MVVEDSEENSDLEISQGQYKRAVRESDDKMERKREMINNYYYDKGEEKALEKELNKHYKKDEWEVEEKLINKEY